MVQEALLGELFVLGAGAAVVGIGIDADATTRGEQADDLDVLGVHQANQVLHNHVDAVFMEIAMVAEAEKAQRIFSKPERLRIMMEKNHAVARLVKDLNLRID